VDDQAIRFFMADRNEKPPLVGGGFSLLTEAIVFRLTRASASGDPEGSQVGHSIPGIDVHGRIGQQLNP
jgi:hypothetical protein